MRIREIRIVRAKRDIKALSRDVTDISASAARYVKGAGADNTDFNSSDEMKTLQEGKDTAIRSVRLTKDIIRKRKAPGNYIAGSGGVYSSKRQKMGAHKVGTRSHFEVVEKVQKCGTSGVGKKLSQNMTHLQIRKTADVTTKGSARAVGQVVKKGFSVIGKGMAGAFKLFAFPASIPLLIIIIMIVVLAAILIIAMSPLGAFFSDSNPANSYSISNIITRVNSDWFEQLALKREYYQDMGYTVNVTYNPGTGDGVCRINNWKDVLALYCVLHSDMNYTLLKFDESDEADIRSLYFEMNPVSVSTRTEIDENQDENMKYADINVSNLRCIQMTSLYPMNENQIKMIEFLLSSEMSGAWNTLGIRNGYGFIDDIDVNAILQNLPAGVGTEIVRVAFSRLGDPYSMELRGQGKYVDCSYLTQWSYAHAGISIPDTAAEQAKYCVNVGKVIDRSALRPGDLIFWSYPNNQRVAGRFMDIGHVAIYIQNGMMIEAAPSVGCVTYRAVSVQGTPKLYGRPYSNHS